MVVETSLGESIRILVTLNNETRALEVKNDSDVIVLRKIIKAEFPEALASCLPSRLIVRPNAAAEPLHPEVILANVLHPDEHGEYRVYVEVPPIKAVAGGLVKVE